MSATALPCYSLIGALLTQSIAAGLSVELFLRRDLPRNGSADLAGSGHRLLVAGLAPRYMRSNWPCAPVFTIMRQAVLAGLVGLFFALGDQRPAASTGLKAPASVTIQSSR
jgi:hypothetical protein